MHNFKIQCFSNYFLYKDFAKWPQCSKCRMLWREWPTLWAKRPENLKCKTSKRRWRLIRLRKRECSWSMKWFKMECSFKTTSKMGMLISYWATWRMTFIKKNRKRLRRRWSFKSKIEFISCFSRPLLSL
jgi:hypothetical protein